MQPHRYRYWLTPPDDEGFEDKVTDACEVYRQAPERHEVGERTVSPDELTSVQALERCHLGLPLAPGKVERRELSGVLRNKQSLIAFLSDPTHRIVFHYTPKHCSWLNQIEIWLSILVRKLFRRALFSSLDDLKSKVLTFIAYYNATLAKPFRWTYIGKLLAV